MAHNRLRETLSRYFDGDLPPGEHAEIEKLLASSEEARDFLARADQLRIRLRDETAEAAPDLTTRVLAAIEGGRDRRRPARKLRVAAAFVAGVFGGVVFIGLALRQPTPVAVADIPEQVLAAQSQVASVTANLQVVERGWHPDVTERTFTGSISYRAPESLWIDIEDVTEYPSSSWVPNHSTYVVDEDLAWSSSVAGCPTEALPSCTPALPRSSVVHNREPFPDAAPAPLDLIVPVAGFTRAEEPEILGYETIDQRLAVGVEVTAAQVAALLDGLTGVGNWRQVHPTDRVELWLDRDAMVPLAVTVYPAHTSDRALWAVRHGYQDSLDVAIIEILWSDVSLNQTTAEFPSPPQSSTGADSGFVDGTPSDLQTVTPGRLPAGMSLHRSGTVTTGAGTEVNVASWSDGRSWLKLRWTRDWEMNRLFGDLGAPVRQEVAGSGVAYVNERGDRIGVHGD
ncbi:MAG: anti-sigma factor family protein, partial [Acidimicrobiia bacterium]